MDTTTFIILLSAAIILLLLIIVGILVWLNYRKDCVINDKNQAIVREVRRNQTIIDKAVQNGVSRAALL